jgi:hypothetical protein
MTSPEPVSRDLGAERGIYGPRRACSSALWLTFGAFQLVIAYLRRRIVRTPQPSDPWRRQVTYVYWGSARTDSSSATARQIPYWLNVAAIVVGMVAPVASACLPSCAQLRGMRKPAPGVRRKA